MEYPEQMYIVKLLSGSLIKTGNYLAKGESDITYFARQLIFEKNLNIFIDLEQNNKSKYAVIIDAEGVGNIKEFIFRNIQFISSSKDRCEEFKTLKARMDMVLYDRMGLTEKLLELIRSGQDQLSIDKIKRDIEELEKELNKLEQDLEVLNQTNT